MSQAARKQQVLTSGSVPEASALRVAPAATWRRLCVHRLLRLVELLHVAEDPVNGALHAVVLIKYHGPVA